MHLHQLVFKITPISTPKRFNHNAKKKDEKYVPGKCAKPEEDEESGA